MEIISVVNQKGGVGKTTTVINLGHSLANEGKKVLLIDLDYQGSLTSALGFNKDTLDAGVQHLLLKKKGIEEVIYEHDNFFFVPANEELLTAEKEIETGRAMEFQLKKVLSTFDGFDYVLIDCPPNLGTLTVNALTASNSVIIPVQTHYLALEGISAFMKTFEEIKDELNPDIKIKGIVPTMFDKRRKLDNDVVGALQDAFGNKCFKAIIKNDVKISESPSHGKTIFEYKAYCDGALNYRSLAREVMEVR
jgi:chromosome partitioning protein